MGEKSGAAVPEISPVSNSLESRSDCWGRMFGRPGPARIASAASSHIQDQFLHSKTRSRMWETDGVSGPRGCSSRASSWRPVFRHVAPARELSGLFCATEKLPARLASFLSDNFVSYCNNNVRGQVANCRLNRLVHAVRAWIPDFLAGTATPFTLWIELWRNKIITCYNYIFVNYVTLPELTICGSSPPSLTVLIAMLRTLGMSDANSPCYFAKLGQNLAQHVYGRDSPRGRGRPPPFSSYWRSEL